MSKGKCPTLEITNTNFIRGYLEGATKKIMRDTADTRNGDEQIVGIRRIMQCADRVSFATSSG